MTSFRIHDPLRSEEKIPLTRQWTFSTPNRNTAATNVQPTMTERILRQNALDEALAAAAENQSDGSQSDGLTGMTSIPVQNETKSIYIPPPTSGQSALSFVRGTSDSLRGSQLRGAQIICAATNLCDTDRAAFNFNKGRIQAADELFALWIKEPEFKIYDEMYRQKFTEVSGPDLRNLLEDMFEYVVEMKSTSVEVATKYIISAATRRTRLKCQQISDMDTGSRAVQLMQLCDAYVVTDHIAYEGTFRGQCQSRTLDLTAIDLSAAVNTDMAQLPGWERLTCACDETRVTAWTWLFVDIVSYLAGAREKNSLCIEDLQSKLYCTSNLKVQHPLRFKLDVDGNFGDVFDWFPVENFAVKRLTDGAATMGLVKYAPVDYDRVGNALRCMETEESLDFKKEWQAQYKDSDEVPDDVVVPKGKWPVIAWDLCKRLMVKAQLALRKDLGKTAERVQIMKNKSKNPPSQPRNPPAQPKNPRQPDASNSPGSCRVCQSKDHTTANCPNRSGEICGFYRKYGRCKFGDKCRLEHVETQALPAAVPSAQPPTVQKPAPTAALPGAVVPTRTQMIVCGTKVPGLPACEPNFTIDMDVWDNLIETKGFVLPKSCKNCREKIKLQKIRDAAALVTELADAADGGHAEDEMDIADDDYFAYDMGMAGCVTQCDPDLEYSTVAEADQIFKMPEDPQEVEVEENEMAETLAEIAEITDWVSAMESHLAQEDYDFGSLCCEVGGGAPFEPAEFDHSVGTSVTSQSSFGNDADCDDDRKNW